MDEVKIEDWVVVNSPGGRYIGQVAGTKDEIVQKVNDGDALLLMNALDFIAPMRPVQTPQGVAMQRDPIIVQPDFVVHPLPVYVKVAAVYFCADMHDDDKKTYKELVTYALRSGLEARASKSGITLAGGMPAPQVPKRG